MSETPVLKDSMVLDTLGLGYWNRKCRQSIMKEMNQQGTFKGNIFDFYSEVEGILDSLYAKDKIGRYEYQPGYFEYWRIDK